MNKKLPNVFQNSINKKINNNEDLFYSANENRDNTDNNNIEHNKMNIKNKKISNNIRKKINEIFASSSYVYKANVIIQTKNETINKRIIGRNQNYLITMDNKTIPIDSIIDIEVKK